MDRKGIVMEKLIWKKTKYIDEKQFENILGEAIYHPLRFPLKNDYYFSLFDKKEKENSK